MTTNRGGRPAHHEGETKRAPITLRTAPSIHEAIKKSADEAGRSLTQEVEIRLKMSLEADGGYRTPETQRLLNRISGEIAAIEAHTGRKWHRHRRSAGAVLEMLSLRPADWIRTDEPRDDEFVGAAWEQLRSARRKRDRAVQALDAIGATGNIMLGIGAGLTTRLVPDENDPPATRKVIERAKGRWKERAHVDKLDLPDTLRVDALALLDELEFLDDEVTRAEQAFADAVEPFVEEQRLGREMYRRLMDVEDQIAGAAKSPIDASQ